MIHTSGILDSIDEEVAMKFTPPEDECNAQREFEVYTCLESINQTNKEAYGIPTVYYYGRWEGSIMMAITLLDSKLKDYQLKNMDILLIFREFVSYMYTVSLYTDHNQNRRHT